MSYGDMISRGDAAPIQGSRKEKPMAARTEKQQREGGHGSPPKGYPNEKKSYADPANYKYPVTSASEVRAAWSYIHKAKNRAMYSASELAAIERRIKAAGKKFGIDFDADDK